MHISSQKYADIIILQGSSAVNLIFSVPDGKRRFSSRGAEYYHSYRKRKHGMASAIPCLQFILKDRLII